MRAVFTLDLPLKEQRSEEQVVFPDSNYILNLIRTFGWEPENIFNLTEKDIHAMLKAQGTNTEKNTENTSDSSDRNSKEDTSQRRTETSNEADNQKELQNHYIRLSVPLFREMPEVAGVEINYVIFLGYIADDQTLFVITRMVSGQITFRLMHRELQKLQSSTEKIIRKLLSAKLSGKHIYITNPKVIVYERAFDHVVLTGRVITNPFQEARRSSLKDFILFIVPLFLFIPAAYVSINFPHQPNESLNFWAATLDRGSTALLTTSLVSSLGFLQTWLQIRKKKLIDWTVDAKDRKNT